ncbi:hypothetical protein [Caproiciproducens sp.]
MDAKYLAEIKAAFTTEMLTDDYRDLRISEIAKLRLYGKKLLAEVERLMKENTALKAELQDSHQDHVDDFIRLTTEKATLKRALELACAELNLSPVEKVFAPDYFIRKAQEQEGKK